MRLWRLDRNGHVTHSSGDLAAQNVFRFSSKYLEESGLSYYGFRYYDADKGRWPSRDPVEEEGGWNLYGFVQNGPVDRGDLLGMTAPVLTPGGTLPGLSASQAAAAWANATVIANDLYARMTALCPPSGQEYRAGAATVPAGGVTGWALPQCCKRPACLTQARDYTDAVVLFATKVWMYEMAKHGNVYGGWRGNYQRGTVDRQNGAYTAGDGMNCGSWASEMKDIYDQKILPSASRGEGCFRGALVDGMYPAPVGYVGARPIWGTPIGVGMGSSIGPIGSVIGGIIGSVGTRRLHEYFELFGLVPPGTPPGVTSGVRLIDFGQPDIVLDPWWSGGAAVLPPTTGWPRYRVRFRRVVNLTTW